MTRPFFCVFARLMMLAGLLAVGQAGLPADEPARSPGAPQAPPPGAPGGNNNARSQPNDKSRNVPPGLVRIAKDYNVWIDPRRKYVVVDGEVCLREGQLEMFACPQGTKEHEAIVAVNCPARFVHAGLLAVGAKQGKPVRFDPQYVPASGTEIDIWVLWKDQRGRRRKVRAQQWVRDIRTGKAMTHKWVFAGSGFWTDEQTGKRYYMADGGDFICVSNFTTATMDLTVKSSASASELMFEAFTERIPNRGTHVRLVLIPQLEKAAPPASKPSGAAAEREPPDRP